MIIKQKKYTKTDKILEKKKKDYLFKSNYHKT